MELLFFSHSVVSNSLPPRGCQASLSFTISWSLLKLVSIESVMPSNYLILCHPLLLLPSIFPSIRAFSNESSPCIRWPKYWSFSFSISSSNEWIFRVDFLQDWLVWSPGSLRDSKESSWTPPFNSFPHPHSLRAGFDLASTLLRLPLSQFPPNWCLPGSTILYHTFQSWSIPHLHPIPYKPPNPRWNDSLLKTCLFKKGFVGVNNVPLPKARPQLQAPLVSSELTDDWDVPGICCHSPHSTSNVMLPSACRDQMWILPVPANVVPLNPTKGHA